MPKDTIFHPADTREFKDFGFMQAYLSFKPHLQEDRHSFGPLITIDDGTLAPSSKGFGFHPHKDVEVVTFLVDGELQHIDPDVPEHTGTLTAKGIQVITAGTGIVHNEINTSDSDPMRALQIWFRPRARHLSPSYSKKQLDPLSYTDRFDLVLAPGGTNGALAAQQEIWLSYGQFTHARSLTYHPQSSGNGLYLFVINGSAQAANQKIGKGDGLALRNATSLKILADSGAELLLFDLSASTFA